MTFDDAVDLAREIEQANYFVWGVQRETAGPVLVSNGWVVIFTPHPHARTRNVARDRATWDYWRTPIGVNRMRAGI